VEDPRTDLSELLVATDVSACWAICKYLQPLPQDKGPTMTTDGRAGTTPNSRAQVGYHQCDFIVELPKAHGYDAVMNIINSVSKQAHFIPTNTTVTALWAAQLYLTHVWKLHGLPKHIVSDCRPQFNSEFTHKLY